MRTLLVALVALVALRAEAAPVGPLSVYLLDAPCRLLDTRGTNRIQAAGFLLFRVQGHCGVPEGAEGAILNVTVAGPDAEGFLTVFAAALLDIPMTSSVNYAAGQTTANAVTVRLASRPYTRTTPSPDAILYSLAGTDVVVDVVGYLR
jgi:hypothetical protein